LPHGRCPMAEVARAVAAREREPLQPGNKRRGISRGNSHFDLEWNPSLNEKSIKNDFIKKVYAILAAQLTLTAALCACFVYVPEVQKVGLGMMQMWWFNWVWMIGAVAILCGITYAKDTYPTNFFYLIGFTAWMSLLVGPLCGAFAAAGKGEAIVYALGATCVIFFALSGYVWANPDKDFSFMEGFLFCALVGNIVFGFIAYMFAWSAAMWFYHVFGVMIFSGFIVYDTDQIVNKVALEDCDTGTAIAGALELYLDIINLFLHLLALFGDRD